MGEDRALVGLLGGHVARRDVVAQPDHGQVLTEESATERYTGVLGVARDPLVSADILGDARASVVDLDLTRVIDGDLVKVMSWYDNEWGYANQMVREALSLTGGVARA